MIIASTSSLFAPCDEQNILLDKAGYVKITDFGFAKKVPFKTYTLCGTPEYMAPEVILSSGHGLGVDWWSFGVLVYEMLVGQPPWVDETGPMGIYQQILGGHLMFPKFVDQMAKDLVKKTVTSDLTLRLGCLFAGASDVKAHVWYTGLDWARLSNRGLVAPLVPSVGGDPEDGGYADTSNFGTFLEAEDPPLPEEVGLNPPNDPFIEW